MSLVQDRAGVSNKIKFHSYLYSLNQTLWHRNGSQLHLIYTIRCTYYCATMWIKLLKFQDPAWHFLFTHRPSNHCCLDVRSCICSECRVWRYAVVQEVVICTVTFCLPGNMNDFYLHGNETFYLTRCWRKRRNNFNSWVLRFKPHSMNLGKNIASIPNFMRVDHGAGKGTKYYQKK